MIKKLAYYVSGHGFGHISRSSVIWEEFLKRGVEVFIITERINFFSQTPKNIQIRSQKIDVGVSQKSSLEIDLEKTKQELFKFREQSKQIQVQEKEFLKTYKPDLIFSDSSSLPFKIAHELGIPAYFIGNFTWDFIYENYKKFDKFYEEVVGELKYEYGLASGGFILPLSCPIDCIKNLNKVSMVGRKPTSSRKEIRESLGFTEEKKYFLFSFGAYGLEPANFNYSNLEKNYQIVVSRLEGFLSQKVFRKDDIHYPNILRACDYVVTKPGYGIVSEAFYAQTPILYTDRGDFAEYPYLVEEMKKILPCAYISQKQLYNFDFSSAIQEISKKKNNFNLSNSLDGAKEIFQFFFSK